MFTLFFMLSHFVVGLYPAYKTFLLCMSKNKRINGGLRFGSTPKETYQDLDGDDIFAIVLALLSGFFGVAICLFFAMLEFMLKVFDKQRLK